MAVCVDGLDDTEGEGKAKGNGTEGTGDARRAAPPPSNMGSSVTPHVEVTGEEVREEECPGVESWELLACGVDTLDLSGCVTWGEGWPALRKALDEGKALAQRMDKPAFLRDTCCGPCMIASTGKPPMFRYHLETGPLHMYLGISEGGDTSPNVYVSPKAKTYWERGLSNTVALTRDFLRELGGSVVTLKPSRCDLCADFRIPGGLGLDLLRGHGVPGDIKTNDFMDGDTLETFYRGSPKATIRARVYDKAKEVLQSGKTWFKDIWKVEVLEDVWRVEFQLRRPALKAYGVESVEDLRGLLGGIWADLAANWFSIRLKDDGNTSRRSVHPWWKAVQACAEKFGVVVEAKRKLSRCENAKPAWYVSRGASLLVGFAVAAGMIDLDEAAGEFAREIRGRWDTFEFERAFMEKQVQLGEGMPEEGGEVNVPF